MIVSLYDKPLLDLYAPFRAFQHKPLSYVAAYYSAVICVCQEFFIAALDVLDYRGVALACNIRAYVSQELFICGIIPYLYVRPAGAGVCSLPRSPQM